MSRNGISPTLDNNEKVIRKNRKPDLAIYVPPASKKHAIKDANKKSLVTHEPLIEKKNAFTTVKESQRPPLLFTNIVYPNDQIEATTVKKVTNIETITQQTIDNVKKDRLRYPQPDPSKLPQQQIEEMLRRYNIPVSDNSYQEDKSSVSSLANFERHQQTPLDSTQQLLSCLNNDLGCFSRSEIKDKAYYDSHVTDSCYRFNDDDVFSLNVGGHSEPPSASSDSTSYISYSLTTGSDLVDVGSQQTTGAMLIAGAQPTNDDDQILSSLPKSYQEFLVGGPTNADGPQIVKPRTPSTGYGSIDLVSVQLSVANSPCNIDPDDLEVQLINESFEEQVKQAQVLSDAKLKAAFYTQPNMTLDSSNGGASSVQISKNSSKSSGLHEIISQQNNIDCVQTKGSQKQNLSKSPSAPSNSVNRGLTWAGWKTVSMSGDVKLTKCDSLLTNAATPTCATTITSAGCDQLEYHIDKKPDVDVTTSCSWVPVKFPSDLADAITLTLTSIDNNNQMDSECLFVPAQHQQQQDRARTATTTPSSSSSSTCLSVTTFASAVNVDLANEEMDSLSKEMIDKILLDDDDDFDEKPPTALPCKLVQDNLVNCTDLTLVTPSLPNNVVEMPEVSKTSLESMVSNFDEDSTGCSILNSIFGTSMANVTTFTCAGSTTKSQDVQPFSAVTDWEDLSDFNSVIPEKVVKKRNDSPSAPIDYFKFNCTRSVILNDTEFGHVLEAYDFSASIHTDDIHSALQQCNCKNYNLYWVDATHALIVLTDHNIALEALQCNNPVIKLRPLRDASAQSRRMAKDVKAHLPFKKRPETNLFAARKLVESHLGKKSQITGATLSLEKARLDAAKEARRVTTQLRDDAWAGNI